MAHIFTIKKINLSIFKNDTLESENHESGDLPHSIRLQTKCDWNG